MSVKDEITLDKVHTCVLQTTFIELEELGFANLEYISTMPIDKKKEELFKDIIKSRNNPNKQDKPYYFKGDNNCNKLLDVINKN